MKTLYEQMLEGTRTLDRSSRQILMLNTGSPYS
jgi:hypothetical protein